MAVNEYAPVIGCCTCTLVESAQRNEAETVLKLLLSQFHFLCGRSVVKVEN